MFYYFKGHLLCPFLQDVLLNGSPECACEVSDPNNIQIVYYKVLKSVILGAGLKSAVSGVCALTWK